MMRRRRNATQPDAGFGEAIVKLLMADSGFPERVVRQGLAELKAAGMIELLPSGGDPRALGDDSVIRLRNVGRS
jgi:DNA-binding transcriptional regulator PaaX